MAPGAAPVNVGLMNQAFDRGNGDAQGLGSFWNRQ